MKGQTDEDASEQEEEGKGEEDTNREISLKAHSIYRECIMTKDADSRTTT